MGSALVLLDATAIPEDRGGVGRYVEELAAHLDGRLAIAVQAHDAERFASIAPDASIHPQSPRIRSTVRRLLWEQTGLPRLANRIGADVIHSPHYTLPLAWRGRRVVTFHDATFFSDGDVHSRVKGVFFRAWSRISSRLADAVVVPSRATAAEFARYLRRTADDFDVAHHGVDTTEFKPQEPALVREVASRVGIGKRRWIAFLGTIEPRKNVPALVRGYAVAASRIPDPPVLVLAGGQGWETGLDDALLEVHPPAEVLRPGFVDAGALPALLSGSEIVAYPSLGEGFGLPVLEAMACGAPVMTTRRLALPEVGGDAVEYTEVDSDSIAVTIGRLLGDPGRRAALSAAGKERAEEFSWAASARVHRRVYDRTAEGDR
ncbi:MAG: glycosyltransferase family 4 protein [Gordonia polyisoprenivorans]|nr:glycosyltransferase family 4 protein [Gordonia polyisoprenivorans]